MTPDSTILITGAAGNLGTLLARHLVEGRHTLRLMYHRKPIAPDIAAAPNVRCVQADLSDPRTLPPVLSGVDVVVHFAGVLFAPRPERFLPETNTRWFSNLVTAALDARVGKVILTSFPQVEGPTTVEQPATGRLDREPISVHAKTRLEEERQLMARTQGTGTCPVILRLGMVYGRGILMIEAARWLAVRRLLCVTRCLEATRCDLFLTVGTSAVVYPAASLVEDAREHGAFTVEINVDPTGASSAVDLAVRGPAEQVLAEIDRRLGPA